MTSHLSDIEQALDAHFRALTNDLAPEPFDDEPEAVMPVLGDWVLVYTVTDMDGEPRHYCCTIGAPQTIRTTRIGLLVAALAEEVR